MGVEEGRGKGGEVSGGVEKVVGGGVEVEEEHWSVDEGSSVDYMGWVKAGPETGFWGPVTASAHGPPA